MNPEPKWERNFHSAIANQNPDAMREAIANGLPINEYVVGFRNENTPLQYAVDQHGGPDVVEVLIAAGADLNAPVIEDGEKGATPLVLAAINGDLPVVKRLLAAGADVNEVSGWGTALILAAQAKRDDATEALLRAGADPHLRLPDTHRNFPGQTALDVAKKEKAKKVIAILQAA